MTGPANQAFQQNVNAVDQGLLAADGGVAADLEVGPAHIIGGGTSPHQPTKALQTGSHW